MPRQSEPNVNNVLADLLRGMFSRTNIISENTQVIADHPGLKPDILVNSIGRSPVVLEAEYLPAHTAEEEAKARLGLEVASNGRIIEAAIALRYPEQLKKATDLPTALKSSTLSWAVFTQKPSRVIKRFPESGWLDGSVEDLADLVRLVSVSQWAVDQATDLMQEGIDRVAKILDEMDNSHSAINMEIAKRLGMVNVRQTRRMACAIIANAMVFHEQIVGMYSGIRSLRVLCGSDIVDPKREMLLAWNYILNEINYWPIFSIGIDILAQIPPGYAKRILGTLEFTASAVNATGVENAHDLTGRIFQTLISDRKFLATFYTLPASAALLARLAIAKMESVDWSDKEAIGKLRIADFACGTGALLSAVYEQIAARHERAGGNPSSLHNTMLEDVLYGCDVMPSAIHISGSTISGAEPAEKFGKSHLYPLPYGRRENGEVKIGSLELLRANEVMTSYNINDPTQRIGSTGEETAAQIRAQIPDEGYDLVIMNPPFTRPGSDWEGSERAEDYIKHFRGLSTLLVTQKDMAKRLSRYTKDTCYHGYAGIASAFAALAHKKLKPGGVLALVLPLSVANGLSWEQFREMLASEYTDVEVLSIADNGYGMSFSSDTGMAECLVIVRKIKQDETPQDRVHFASLRLRPRDFVHASSLAAGMPAANHTRRIEDGPYGGTPLMVGNDIAGEAVTAPRGANGEGWSAVRLADFSVSQTAYALSQSKLWLPGMASYVELKMVPLGEVGKRGWYHINLAGSTGPFTKAPPSATATFPVLWNHHATQETRIVCIPDLQLLVKQKMEDKASEAWATAGRSHITQDFRFTSQPLTGAFTENKSLGGTAWPNVNFDNDDFDYPFVLWSNSTLGLLLFWWSANRQQDGRARTTIHAVNSLPTLDLRTLTDAQLAKAEEIFNEFRDKDLLPAYLADADPNRALLDRRVICDLLGFDQDIYHGVRRLAAKWCAEPSVHGGKKRPKDAQFVA